jgi:hypothetical protein
MFLEIDRSNIRKYRINIGGASTSPASGQVVMRIERFALTSNNISYALSGDFLDYWGFFPTEEGWGRLPAMGYGIVTASAHPDIAVGGRYFGFFPVGDVHIVDAEPSRTGFNDNAPYREKHAMAYRSFDKVEPVSTDAQVIWNEDAVLIYRGLFLTAYLADDFLADKNFYEATQVIVTSASSKTSLALAHCLKLRPNITSVGLTSASNKAFVESTGLYDQVLSYEDIETLPTNTASVVVDMAGNTLVVGRIHEHFDTQLKYSMSIGATHWDKSASSTNILGPKPQFFFAPGQLVKRGKEWGREVINERLDTALDIFINDARTFSTIDYAQGPTEVERVYNALINGTMPPQAGNILSM